MTTVKIVLAPVTDPQAWAKVRNLIVKWAGHHGGKVTFEEGTDWIAAAEFQSEAAAGVYASELNQYLLRREN